MRVGAFELVEPLPRLQEPIALVALRPWVDVGGAGTSTLAFLEHWCSASPLGSLARPGDFFDFTRYRPTIRAAQGQRQITVPNSFINWGSGAAGKDFVFLHLLEPQMQGEVYVESVLEVLQALDVKRYCLVGGMHDAVPHTRPLIVTGSHDTRPDELRELGVQISNYEGPTSIIGLVPQEASKMGVEVTSLMVHLPQYAELDIDYAGQSRLLEVLSSLYGLDIDLAPVRRAAEKQYSEMTRSVDKDPDFKQVLEQLEAYYETRAGKTGEEPPRLAPEIEQFLRDINKRFGKD